MGDEQERNSELALQRFEFDLHLPSQIGVEGRKRLIEKKQARAVHEGTRQSDALLLAAANLRRFGASVGCHFDHGQRLFDASCDLFFCDLRHA